MAAAPADLPAANRMMVSRAAVGRFHKGGKRLARDFCLVPACAKTVFQYRRAIAAEKE